MINRGIVRTIENSLANVIDSMVQSVEGGDVALMSRHQNHINRLYLILKQERNNYGRGKNS